MRTYYCTMDDGTTVNFRRQDAATAIQDALEECPGRKVIKCVAGFPSDPNGCITYDVPPHKALPADYVKPKKSKRGR